MTVNDVQLGVLPDAAFILRSLREECLAKIVVYRSCGSSEGL